MDRKIEFPKCKNCIQFYRDRCLVRNRPKHPEQAACRDFTIKQTQDHRTHANENSGLANPRMDCANDNILKGRVSS